jgi:putative redox protein
MTENNTLDKHKEIIVSLRLLNDRLNYMGEVGGQAPVSIDYIPPSGDELGYMPLELFLMSLASCFSLSLTALLRRKGRSVQAVSVLAKGYRKEKLPTGFERIIIELNLTSPDATSDEVDDLINLVEGSYCPVYAMIKGNVEVDYEVRIIQ